MQWALQVGTETEHRKIEFGTFKKLYLAFSENNFALNYWSDFTGIPMLLTYLCMVTRKWTLKALVNEISKSSLSPPLSTRESQVQLKIDLSPSPDSNNYQNKTVQNKQSHRKYLLRVSILMIIRPNNLGTYLLKFTTCKHIKRFR